MVKQGAILHNAVTKDVLEFLETNESSGGKQSKIKLTVKPGSFKPAMHIHQLQDEYFEVVSGYYTCEYRGEKKRLGPGESISFPKAEAHTHYNDENTDCVVIQTVTPALDFEDIMARLFELADQGKIVNGEPPLLEVMVWLQKYKAKTYLAKAPIGVQNAMSVVLAPIGRMLGHGV